MTLLLLAGLAYVVLISLILLFNFGAARASRGEVERFQGPAESDFEADPAVGATYISSDEATAESNSRPALMSGQQERC